MYKQSKEWGIERAEKKPMEWRLDCIEAFISYSYE